MHTGHRSRPPALPLEAAQPPRPRRVALLGEGRWFGVPARRYTMYGPEEESAADQLRGTVPRASRHVFASIVADKTHECVPSAATIQ